MVTSPRRAFRSYYFLFHIFIWKMRKTNVCWNQWRWGGRCLEDHENKWNSSRFQKVLWFFLSLYLSLSLSLSLSFSLSLFLPSFRCVCEFLCISSFTVCVIDILSSWNYFSGTFLQANQMAFRNKTLVDFIWKLVYLALALLSSMMEVSLNKRNKENLCISWSIQQNELSM